MSSRSSGTEAPSTGFLVRVGIGISMTVLLALTSTVSFAAWTASTSKSATAAVGTMKLSSSGIANLEKSYKSDNLSAITAVTVTNSGTVPLALTELKVAAVAGYSDTLGGNHVSIALWKPVAGACNPAGMAGALTRSLAVAGNVDISGANLSAPPVGQGGPDTTICIGTELLVAPGTPFSSLAGLSLKRTLTLTGAAGSWSTADTGTALTFTQSVQGVPAPTGVSCAPGDGYRFFLITYDTVQISWTAPVAGVTTYDVLLNSEVIASVGGTVTSVELNGNQVPGNGTITVRAVMGGIASADSNEQQVASSSHWFNRNVNCAI